MNSQEHLKVWSARRAQVEVSDDFLDSVMNRIVEHEQKRKRPLVGVRVVLERSFTKPWAKAGAIAAGIVLGVARLAFVIRVVLG